MPVLLSLNSYHYRRGGSDVVYLDHADLMASEGWDVRFFSMEHPRNLETNDAAYFAKTVDFEFAQTPISKMKAALRTIYNRDALKRLDRLLHDAKAAGAAVDVAHVHCIYHHLTPSVLPVLKKHGIKVVMTAHDLKVACPAYKMMNSRGVCEECKSGKYFNIVRNRCIKNSIALSVVIWAESELHRILKSYRDNLDAIVTPSAFYRRKLIEWGWPESCVHHIPNFTRQIDAKHIGSYKGNILYFGRLAPEKGLETLIRASKLSKIQVDVIGDGPESTRLHQLAQNINAPVTFFGRLGGDALWDKVGQARAIVLPSEWYENAPMSVLEAYQLLRPVIGADIGGIPELIHTPDGDAGWTFAPGDVEALGVILNKVMQMEDIELEAHAQRGRKLAAESFSERSYLRSMLSIYNTRPGVTPHT